MQHGFETEKGQTSKRPCTLAVVLSVVPLVAAVLVLFLSGVFSPPPPKGDASPKLFVQPSDPAIYWTEYNWFVTAEVAQTNNPGAYMKVGFTGTSAALALAADQADVGLRWSVDEGPYVDAALPASSNPLPLAASLPPGNHTLILYVTRTSREYDRWTPLVALRVTALVLDVGARVFRVPLRPLRMLVYGDSISEGVNVFAGMDDATHTWVSALPLALNAEVSVVAFAGQGFVRAGLGGVPAFSATWDKLDASHPRSFAVQPDFVFCNHGTNDADATDNQVILQASAWLVQQRAATPASAIVLLLPFGGFKRQALTTAFEYFKDSHSDSGDSFLVDLGSEASKGLTSWPLGTPTRESVDGLHPHAFRSLELGAAVAVATVRL